MIEKEETKTEESLIISKPFASEIIPDSGNMSFTGSIPYKLTPELD